MCEKRSKKRKERGKKSLECTVRMTYPSEMARTISFP
jgi:hypothetical protein